MPPFRSPITREAVAAAALAAGSMLCLVVMLLHPSGHDLIDGDRVQAVRRDRLVHGVAIGAIVMQTFGTLGITRRVARASLGLAEFAQIAQATAAVAGLLAAVASGFVAPGLLALRSDGPPPELWQLNWQANQAFAAIYVFATAAATTAWSLAGSGGRLPRWVCAFGATAAPLAATMLAIGHLRLGIHGFGSVLLGQAIWTIGAAHALWRPHMGRETGVAS